MIICWCKNSHFTFYVLIVFISEYLCPRHECVMSQCIWNILNFFNDAQNIFYRHLKYVVSQMCLKCISIGHLKSRVNSAAQNKCKVIIGFYWDQSPLSTLQWSMTEGYVWYRLIYCMIKTIYFTLMGKSKSLFIDRTLFLSHW